MEEAVKSIDLQEIPPSEGEGPRLFQRNLELIREIEVTVTVVVGRAKMTVDQLFALKDGSTLALDVAVNDPVELYLDGKIIGRGELVAVDENFGIRMTQVGATGL